MIRFLIPLALFISLDIYAFQAFRTVSGNTPTVGYIYWGLHFLIYGFTLFALFMRNSLPGPVFMVLFSLIFALYIPKLLIVVALLLEDLSRLIRALFGGTASASAGTEGGNTLSRSKFISQIALFAAGVPFIGMVYGILRGKYDYQIRRIQVAIENLPEAFQGLKITHISDIHTGSFDNKDAVSKGIDLINEQESDLVFFTGDLINTYIDEIEGFEELYARIRAKEGVFSTLGNHDYGDYARWPDVQSKREHFEKVKAAHQTFGWRLLMNENHLLRRGEDTLAVIGIENWSAHNRFPKYGKLDQAVRGTESAQVKLLLSHDPSHWEAQVCDSFSDIDVMFSGHTHGFQFGIEIPGFRWSPVQYVYKQWAGLYQKGAQYLYVNRGFGFLGFSGRIGMRPEITVMELVRA